MATDNRDATTAENLIKVGMVIYGSMILAVLVYLGVVLLSREEGVSGVPADSTLVGSTYVAAGFGLAMLFAVLVLVSRFDVLFQKMVTKTSEEGSRDLTLARALFTRGIIIAGLLEGAALFNLTVYKLEGRVLSIGVVGVLLLALASQFPTRDRAFRWIERQKRRIEGGDWFDR